MIRTWRCGNGHEFTFGDEDWHYDRYINQGVLDDGSPIPSHCLANWDYTDSEAGIYKGESCLDSSSLIYA